MIEENIEVNLALGILEGRKISFENVLHLDQDNQNVPIEHLLLSTLLIIKELESRREFYSSAFDYDHCLEVRSHLGAICRFYAQEVIKDHLAKLKNI